MNNKLKITFPPLPDGADRWKLYIEYQSPVGRDPWRWYNRLIWRVLMCFHDRAERLWHWLWDIAQPFKEPPMKYERKYREVSVLNAADGCLTVEDGLELTNGQPLIRSLGEPK